MHKPHPRRVRAGSIVALLCLLGPSSSVAQSRPVLVGLGDSIGEGVQSGDANQFTQPASYLNWIAFKLRVPFALPLIQSGPLGVVGDPSLRRRFFPDVGGLNLSVSGASVSSILRRRADAASPAEIDSETDLVLFPRTGSQIEVAEALNPHLVICWIGNNDVLSSVTHFDQLDASQMTSVAAFRRDFTELAGRLGALEGRVVLANIPDVTSIAFLLDRHDLNGLLGSDYGLPEGDFTSLPAAMLIRLGLSPPSLLKDPSYVLDAAEVARIQERIEAFNHIIAENAATLPAPVFDVNGLFRSLVEDPPVILGIPITDDFLGGLFSLDGIHPSNIGQALVADQMLARMSSFYGMPLARVTPRELRQIVLTDPFLDKDRDGSARGRPFTSLLETIALAAGFTGDPNDFNRRVSVKTAAPGAGSRKKLERDAVVRQFRRIWRSRSPS